MIKLLTQSVEKSACMRKESIRKLGDLYVGPLSCKSFHKTREDVMLSKYSLLFPISHVGLWVFAQNLHKYYSWIACQLEPATSLGRRHNWVRFQIRDHFWIPQPKLLSVWGQLNFEAWVKD